MTNSDNVASPRHFRRRTVLQWSGIAAAATGIGALGTQRASAAEGNCLQAGGEGSLKARASTLARGGMDAAGFVRSPYSVGGKQRLFAEPPHMQASMLFLPGGDAPQVGDRIDVRVRYTATDFDEILIDG